MLKSLAISNYALIDSLTIEFNRGFSVITGETGAGKSILLGALGLILGQRSDSGVLMDKKRKCVVEALFDISNYSLKLWMDENDLDYDAQTIIRREISSVGKSRAFINDTPVNLQTLKEFTSALIDIHSQHQTLLLSENHFQLKVVDVVADTASIAQDYNLVYSEFKMLAKRLEELVETHNKQKSDHDYWRFQYDQLDEGQLIVDEQETLENRLQQLNHAEEIKTTLSGVVNLLDGERNSVLITLREAQGGIHKVARYLDAGEDYINRLESAFLDLKDLSDECQSKEVDIDVSPNEIEEMQSRLSMIYDLQQKHQVSTVNELLVIKEELNVKLSLYENYEVELSELKSKLDNVYKKLSKISSQLTSKRKSGFTIIESYIIEHLKKLGMPNASMKIVISEKSEFGADGKDEITFQFSANKSVPLAPISKVASGGEMSRLMLCIKALISSSNELPTLILDEIDTGVSGEIAHQMGLIMAEMASGCQLISITHLPQIAGRGETHYKVFKVEENDSTSSRIEQLDKEQRVVEIAKMLSGSQLSDAALKNAQELLQN